MKVRQVALLSFGDLKGRVSLKGIKGPILTEKDYYVPRFMPFTFLSKAAADALDGTLYDTLVNVDVITRTWLFTWSNEMEVTGARVNRKTLPRVGGVQ